MKAYMVELLIIDHDGVGEKVIRDELENTKYANWCISPNVKSVTCKDIGEWSDDHPLNRRDTAESEYRRLFGKCPIGLDDTPQICSAGTCAACQRGR